jgi:formylglycine-generating enzyme required for sulfatase activity
MGKFVVTQAQWRAVAGMPKVDRALDPAPSKFKDDHRPVEQITWYEAVEFCERLSQKTGKLYRLPSEAEWEYACRAGTTSDFYCGDTITMNFAHYDYSKDGGISPPIKKLYRNHTIEVGSFPPNAFGLYDMHGNVWEWCADYWFANYQGAPIDGSASIAGGNKFYRMLRGGSWKDKVWDYCRSSTRLKSEPDSRNDGVGFRVVCGLA